MQTRHTREQQAREMFDWTWTLVMLACIAVGMPLAIFATWTLQEALGRPISDPTSSMMLVMLIGLVAGLLVARWRVRRAGLASAEEVAEVLLDAGAHALSALRGAPPFEAPGFYADARLVRARHQGQSSPRVIRWQDVAHVEMVVPEDFTGQMGVVCPRFVGADGEILLQLGLSITRGQAVEADDRILNFLFAACGEPQRLP